MWEWFFVVLCGGVNAWVFVWGWGLVWRGDVCLCVSVVLVGMWLGLGGVRGFVGVGRDLFWVLGLVGFFFCGGCGGVMGGGWVMGGGECDWCLVGECLCFGEVGGWVGRGLRVLEFCALFC